MLKIQQIVFHASPTAHAHYMQRTTRPTLALVVAETIALLNIVFLLKVEILPELIMLILISYQLRYEIHTKMGLFKFQDL